jgi:hypothetical protein
VFLVLISLFILLLSSILLHSMSQPSSTLRLEMRPEEYYQYQDGVYTSSNVFNVLKRYLDHEGTLSMERACEELYQMMSHKLPTGEQRGTSHSSGPRDAVPEDGRSSHGEMPENQQGCGRQSEDDRVLSEMILCISGDIPYNHEAQIKLVNLVREVRTCDILNEPQKKVTWDSDKDSRGEHPYQDYNYDQYLSMPVFQQASARYVGGTFPGRVLYYS